MAKQWILALAVVGPVVVAADELDDFSNNLATDLGPLLVLFGEAMTKQYLSESTSFLDYFIFAMAPIGVLTAMAAAIRVCGYSTLRAFIGRSQEGQGTVEAELCTSTGRDVCELFTRGGITRALGRPSILELVHVPGTKDDDGDKAGVHSFRQWVGSNGGERWHMTKESKEKHQESLWGNDLLASHPPNISLNVGIIKRPRWVFIVVAITGFTLQAGLVGLAAVGGWKLGWAVNKAGASSSVIYAPIMYIIGTTLMSLGMWGCAAVIGQTTHEIQYKRRPDELKKPQTRLFWLQPGPQFIGDQCFDPFAFTEDEPMKDWTLSTKNALPKLRFRTTLAVGATLIGYIMQFIGLRGMKAWVSLAQLAATVLMSMIRGGLRAQRISQSANRLAENREVPDAVTGHELDWMAFELLKTASEEWPAPKKKNAAIGKSMRCWQTLLLLKKLAFWEKSAPNERPASKKEILWHITGQYKQALGPTDDASASKLSSPSKHSSSTDADALWSTGSHDVTRLGSTSTVSVEKENVRPNSSSTGATGMLQDNTTSNPPQKDGTDQTSCTDLLRTRARLAHLTGHIPFGATTKEGQQWKNNQVKVRTKANEISSAICQTAAKLIPWKDRNSDIVLQIIGSTSTITNTGNKISNTINHSQTLGITLKPPSESTLAGWQIDSARVEAILGLWMWSLVSNGREVDQVCFRNEKLPTRSIVSAGRNTQQELSFWLGSQGVKVTEATLQIGETHINGLIDLWRIHDKSSSECISNKADKSTSEPGQIDILTKVDVNISKQNDVPFRLCGWNAVCEALALEKTSDSAPQQCTVRMFPTAGSLLDICARELFATLAASLTGIAEVVKPNFVNQQDDYMLLQSETVTILTTAVMENGLGSRADAILSVIPALGEQIAIPIDEEMMSATIAMADSYRRRGEWLWAERLLQWLCHICSSSNGQKATASTTGGRSQFARALRATGELYRWSLRKGNFGCDEACAFGRAGIDWMHRTYPCTDPADETTQILCCYRYVQKKLETDSRMTPLELCGMLAQAVDNQHDENARGRALYCLCLVENCSHESLSRRAVPFAARNGWDEVLGSMLQLGANVNASDERNRTALWYSAESGNANNTKQCIDAGADTEIYCDGTPLYVAVQNGHEAIVQQLIAASAKVEVQRCFSEDGPLHIAVRNRNEAIVEKLISAGAEVNRKGDRGHTPLHLAAECGNTAIAKRLTMAGALVDAIDRDGNAPLHIATAQGDKAMVDCLVTAGANVNVPSEETSLYVYRTVNRDDCSTPGTAPLHIAARMGHTAIAEYLMDAGAGFDMQDREGRTPLHYAASLVLPSMVDCLLRAGAFPDARDHERNTPLLLVAGSKHTKSTCPGERRAVAKMLIDRLAYVDAEDMRGCTPLQLHRALDCQEDDLIEYLVEQSEAMDIKDERGNTPRHDALLYMRAREKIDLKNSQGAQYKYTAPDNVTATDRVAWQQQFKSRQEKTLVYGSQTQAVANYIGT
ncbi:ankyrin repeat domain-containing protein 28 [Cordyceps militaris CM01]|uniref:Ankyrin repeat domain-containing protein 28 n=1 Tax=Cordyceps militaris (strain CM01) TaxID=983644 RepID=G3JJD9_CORMM|nr:ankyrin repeat domain-containing protein 28 [Cordyceps militaris CM01]EGX91233.1 ankyrin repeat domain-containing protein 28 [Cordyceps militaris CM01]